MRIAPTIDKDAYPFVETNDLEASFELASVLIGLGHRRIGLINGLEQLIGTKPFNTDSDGDGLGDGVEFPLAGISMSDPCDGPNVQCDLATLFSDSFE